MENILLRLQQQEIKYQLVKHQEALTSEDLDKYLKEYDGVKIKNLFVKDKKGGLYIISLQSDKNFSIKNFSIRLGMGKSGVRFAPNEAVQEVLQVPQGSVTPLAVLQDNAKHVSVILDKSLQSEDKLWVHPNTNKASVKVSAQDLEKLLRKSSYLFYYVDLDQEPVVDKDNPPDLAFIANEQCSILQQATESKENPHTHTHTSISQQKENTQAQAATNVKVNGNTNDNSGNKSVKTVKATKGEASIPKAKEAVLKMGDYTQDLIKQIRQADVSTDIKHENFEDLIRDQLTMLYNSAYARGFSAAK